MTQNALKTFRFVRLALMAGVGFPLILASNAFAQLPAPAVPAEPDAPAAPDVVPPLLPPLVPAPPVLPVVPAPPPQAAAKQPVRSSASDLRS